VKFEIIFDDKDFTVWKIGLWEFTRTSDGKAFWEFTGQAEQEFRNLTRGMLYSNRTKPVDRKGGKP